MQCWLTFHYTLHGACSRWSKCDHITPLICQLHWLQVSWWIDYKLAVLVYKYFHSLAPSYLADKLYHPAELKFQRRLRSASSRELYSPYLTLNLRWPRFSSHCYTDLEQSSAAYHICSVTSRLLLSLEDIILQTQLPVITNEGVLILWGVEFRHFP